MVDESGMHVRVPPRCSALPCCFLLLPHVLPWPSSSLLPPLCGSTVMPLLSALGMDLVQWPPYASNLVFELWELPTGEHVVRVL